MIVTDAQVHVWEAHRPDRPWPAEHRASPAFVAVPGARPHRAEPIGAAEMVALMDAAGVARAVIVPPSPVGDCNDTALEAAAQYPDRFAVMGRFDPTAPGAQEALASWLTQPHMAGIRMTFHKAPWDAWLDDATLDAFWADCERLGIPVMLLIPGRLDALERIARRHPGLQLIIDHLGRRSDLRDDACFADLDAMLRLGALDNVSVKASAAPCYSTESYPFANLRPHLKRVYEHFGPRRTFWGSDVSRLPCTYREAVDHFVEALDFIPRDELPWVMGRGLSRVLKWAEPPAEFADTAQ
jgi:predicted TIM-barrel fold metal-dependent hydrolase